MTDDTRDRVIALEVKVDNLTKAVESRDKKIDEMHEAFMKTRGAWYVILAVAAGAGGITSFLIKLFPWANSLPR